MSEGGTLTDGGASRGASAQRGVDRAYRALRSGRVLLADVVLRRLWEAGVRDPVVAGLRGMVHAAVGDHAGAAALLLECERGLPRGHEFRAEVARALGASREALGRHGGRSTRAPAGAVHVIRAWGQGFFSDVDQVVGHLLLAEMAGRRPIVLWGEGSRFRDAGDGNAWEHFFEPLGDGSLVPTGPCFPSKWDGADLTGPDRAKMAGPQSRMDPIAYLFRPEMVTVGDFMCQVETLRAWIPARGPGSRWHGQSTEGIWRGLWQEHVRPRADLVARAEAFVAERLRVGGAPTLAVHLRGSDKVGELQDLARAHEEQFAVVEGMIDATPGMRIFAMTDSEPLLARMRERWTGRHGASVVWSESARTSTGVGTHFGEHASRRALGEEVLVDALIARGCERFVGLGLSNVAAAVAMMRPWAEGSLRLVGPLMQTLVNEFLLEGAPAIGGYPRA